MRGKSDPRHWRWTEMKIKLKTKEWMFQFNCNTKNNKNGMWEPEGNQEILTWHYSCFCLALNSGFLMMHYWVFLSICLLFHVKIHFFSIKEAYFRSEWLDLIPEALKQRKNINRESANISQENFLKRRTSWKLVSRPVFARMRGAMKNDNPY